MSLPAETADLFAAAKAEGCESVLDSFCDEYIRAFVRQSLEDGMSFRDMVRKMKRAVDVYEEIHKLEDRMDKNLFVRLVKGGYCTFGKGRCSPLSPMDNSSTMFLQAAKLQKGFWEIDSSSPEGAAIIRACLWQYEILMSRNATTPEEACIIVHDEIGRSPLDINFGIKGTCIGMLYSISLVRNERIYMVGVSALQSLTLSMVKKFVPGGRLDRLQVLSTREELIGILCRDEIPDFWMTAGSHPCPNDRNDIWQYERCLHNTNRITLKDVRGDQGRLGKCFLFKRIFVCVFLTFSFFALLSLAGPQP